jgi:hypothetical protein
MKMDKARKGPSSVKRLYGFPGRPPIGKVEADFVIRNIGQLLTLDGEFGPRRRVQESDLGYWRTYALPPKMGS